MKKLPILALIFFSLFLIFLTSSVQASEPYFNANAAWIQDAGWPRLNPYILSKNLTKVIDDLTKNHIKYAIVMVGYYDGSSPNNTVLWQRTTTGGYMDGGPPNVTFYTSIVNALHAANITAIAWIEDTNGPIDVRPSNWNNLMSQINLTLQWGFDGYSDDIETINGTWQDYINWLNNVTVWLHSLGKLSMPAVGYDWRMDTNPYLHVDYIVTMFYGAASLFDPSNPYSREVEAYWQENFGMYGGQNNPPASPVILGIMNFYGNRYPLAWQLDRAGYLIKKYGAPQLKGFSLWLYEYMGTNPTDWNQWNYWITHVNTTYSPPLNILNITTSPMTGVPMMFEGTDLYKLPYEPFFSPKLEYLFNGTVSITTPSQAIQETHYVLFGDSDHTGGSMGYSVYTYAGGPYNLTSSANVNSLYFYCKATGNVKIAIYNATKYHIEGWIGTDYHPYGLVTKSNATHCVSNSWVLINVTPVTLPAGIYFIAIKGDTTGIIGASGVPPQPVGGDIYGYNQFITEDYNTAFKQIFPTVEGAMGEEPSVYVPIAPMILTNYNFSRWENGETALTRYVNANENKTIIAYYTTEASLRRIFGKLTDKNGNPIDAKIIVFQKGTDSIISSNQTDSQGNYNLLIPPGIYDIQLNLTNFFIKILSVNISQDIVSPIKQITSEENKLTVLLESNHSNKVGVYSIKKPLRVKLNGTIIPSWSYNENNKLLSINLSVVIAKSGYWRDIQEAVDLVASMGGGNVYIPEGTFNFVNVNESWTGARVVIPAGVNLFGVRTERYENGSVKECKTVLVMPWDMPGSNSYDPPQWFKIQGSADPSKPSRISDIKLVGYREIDSNSTQIYRGIKVDSVINFRIDHLYFRHIPEGIAIIGHYSSGVIDHNIFDNVYGWHGGTVWANRTIGYGIAVNRDWKGETEWENITNILGKYTNHTVFIEDNVFTKWRHCAVGNNGAHYVFRHNVITNGSAFGEVDVHPMWIQPYVPGRAIEVYENQFIDPSGSPPGYPSFMLNAVIFNSGGGVIFNNTIKNHTIFIYTNNASWSSDFYPHDIYIWNNTLINVSWGLIGGDAVENEDYFLYKPEWYSPYPYPHPLTIET